MGLCGSLRKPSLDLFSIVLRSVILDILLHPGFYCLAASPCAIATIVFCGVYFFMFYSFSVVSWFKELWTCFMGLCLDIPSLWLVFLPVCARHYDPVYDEF